MVDSQMSRHFSCHVVVMLYQYRILITFNENDNNSINDKNDNNNNIKFKTSMVRSSLYDYSDAYILVNGTRTAPDSSAEGVPVNNTNKKIMFKNFSPVTSCITGKNYTQVENAEDIEIVIPTYVQLNRI